MDIKRILSLNVMVVAAVAMAGECLIPSSGTVFKARPGTQVRQTADGWLDVSCDGTYGWPGVELLPRDGGTWDFSRIGAIEVVVSNMGVRTAFAAAKPAIIAATNFFPFCDRYGQFKHADWPGKIHSDDELLKARRREEAWLAAHRESPIPDADKYGGWKGGPQLAATGFFRTEKVDGRWWLVDPEGHLFFSLGIAAGSCGGLL
jgi:hypothetical protein